ncbi:MAG: ketoacyl-ACP synthase III [Candidatus Scalindua sp. AMX11]|nr:MAG: ketoacyl-ACP synthase III [Candidatus Scalindua sp.]NOG85064.1 ketoacyl-ACP synthase III [Planctomycetota bacterium]RZV93112.1 MAG: ketoacyl-ACP synthase III [Candidatus Scalindua sp. SCAELEC01]TDE66738.1 MAG: ketoacyl-ACP synthase III [Candidatus Scalindua sp. AMX11]GJQ58048.1 MAG: 3-oxoacyl-[acyl-carrier-protein] synthase 3 [Candidatus Scalindua sp.]
MGKVCNAAITGLGSFLPEKVLSNDDLLKMVNTSDEWITKRTGIKERRIVDSGTATSDLAVEASLRALDDAKVLPSELDLIVTSTITPDCLFPSTSCFVQDRIGATKAGAFDILAACAGFIYALSIAKNFIVSGTRDTVLVVGAECLSKVTDYTDRTTCVLFGDGAGAAVVQKSKGRREIVKTLLGADGSQADLLMLPAGGSRLPASHETVDSRSHYIKLKGKVLFKLAVTNMVEVILKSVKENNITIQDVDLIIPHQSNIRIIEAAMERLSLPKEKAYVNIDRFGNTSSASIPIAMDEIDKNNLLKPGSTVLLVAFGGGLTWSSSIIKW